MNHSIVCASCARQILRRARRARQSQWHRQSSAYVPISAQNQATLNKSKRGQSSTPAATIPSAIPPTEGLDSLREGPYYGSETPEDDFLHRLFRGLTTADEPPDLYSRPRLRQSAEEREKERLARSPPTRPKRRTPTIYSDPRPISPTTPKLHHPAFTSKVERDDPGSTDTRLRKVSTQLKSQVGFGQFNNKPYAESALDFFEGERVVNQNAPSVMKTDVPQGKRLVRRHMAPDWKEFKGSIRHVGPQRDEPGVGQIPISRHESPADRQPVAQEHTIKESKHETSSAPVASSRKQPSRDMGVDRATAQAVQRKSSRDEAYASVVPPSIMHAEKLPAPKIKNARKKIQSTLKPLDKPSALTEPLAEHTSSTSSAPQLPTSREGPIVRIRTATRDSSDTVEEKFCKRIGDAIEDKDLNYTESLWKQANTLFGNSKSSEWQQVPLEVCRLILTAFMACRSPIRATEVWNEMMAKGISPSIGMWNAMLKGCSMALDARGFNDMWQRLLASKTQLDATCWGTRIHGLARTRQLDAAVQAFNQMTQNWIAAAVKHGHKDLKIDMDFEGAPKPNNLCLNPLVKALVQSGRYKDMITLFQTGKKIGLRPDGFTLNGLFKAAMEENNPALAKRLLQLMQSLGVQPDIATFTMLLDSAFLQPLADPDPNDLRELTPPSEAELNSPFGKLHPQRCAAIKGIFEEMEAAGHPPTDRTYSHLVIGLLRDEEIQNVEAAYAVIDHMHEKGLFIESSIFTTLVTYHLTAESPPNVDAAEKVWNMAIHRAFRKTALDSIFWDRLIEGFARAGSVRHAMQALRQCREHGRRPGWVALKEIVRSLLGVGDRVTAEDIVVEVFGEEHKRKTEGTDKLRLNKGKDEFWDTVRQAGLLPAAHVSSRGYIGVNIDDKSSAVRGV